MRCTRCATTPLITIRMRIGEREVVFRRCPRCERNRWEVEEEALALDDVLELARSAA